MPPDQFGFDGLEEGVCSRIVITVNLAAHRYCEPMLAQDLLIVMRTILGLNVGMMDAVLGCLAQGNGHILRADCKVALHPVCDGPADGTLRMQVQNHGQIER